MNKQIKTITRNAIFFIVLLIGGLCNFESCNQSDNSAISDPLQQKIDSLEKVNAETNSQLSDISEYMSIISEGLDSIAAQEAMIINGTSKGVEGRRMTKAEIRESLQAFADLVERQRHRIAQLEDTLQNRGESLEKLRNIIVYLNQQLDDKNQTITRLQASINSKNADIQKLNKQVTNLTATNEELTTTIEAQGTAIETQEQVINECYVKVGTKAELKKAGVLTGGGFLSKAKLNASGFSSAGFTKVDIRQFRELPIPSKSVKILTQMPTSSYSITTVGKESVLTIHDPAAFWGVSNYLVIQTK